MINYNKKSKNKFDWVLKIKYPKESKAKHKCGFC